MDDLKPGKRLEATSSDALIRLNIKPPRFLNRIESLWQC